MKKIQYYIPIALQNYIENVIESNIDLFKLSEKQKIRLSRTLISLWLYIYEQQAQNEDIETLKEYVNINSRDIKMFTFQNLTYRDLIDLLGETIEINHTIENGKIIEKYSKGRFSKSYRIKTDFIGTEYGMIEIDFDKVFENLKSREHWLKLYPDHFRQIENLYNIKIDLGAYHSYLQNNLGKPLKPKSVHGYLKNRFLTPTLMYSYLTQALKINYGNIWVKISQEGRFYSSFTNLSSTARPFLKLKRRPLKEIDVVNCQPLLLSLIIHNEAFQKDVENGYFYDKIAEVLNRSRDVTKILLYKYIFFNNEPIKSGRLYDCLEKLYPNFVCELNKLKNVEISKRLQQIESSIFIEKISKMDFDILTLHDAVYVYEEDYDLIKGYIKQEFNKLGLNVKMK